MRSGLGVPQKSEVERHEHQHDARVDREPPPEVVSEHEDVDSDYHDCHRYHEDQVRDWLGHVRDATGRTWLAWASAQSLKRLDPALEIKVRCLVGRRPPPYVRDAEEEHAVDQQQAPENYARAVVPDGASDHDDDRHDWPSPANRQEPVLCPTSARPHPRIMEVKGGGLQHAPVFANVP